MSTAFSIVFTPAPIATFRLVHWSTNRD